MGTYLYNVTYYRAHVEEEILPPLSFESLKEIPEGVTPAVLVCSGREFYVDETRLLEEIPCFREDRKEVTKNFTVSTRDNIQYIDLGTRITPRQLKVLLKRLDDKPMKGNLKDLFIASIYFGLDILATETKDKIIKESLNRAQLPTMNEEDSPIWIEFINNIRDEFLQSCYRKYKNTPLFNVLKRITEFEWSGELNISQRIPIKRCYNLDLKETCTLVKILAALTIKIERLCLYGTWPLEDLKNLLVIISTTPYCLTITQLEFSEYTEGMAWHGFQDEGIDTIAPYLKMFTHLETLSIRNQHFTEKSLLKLADNFPPHLKELNIQGNSFYINKDLIASQLAAKGYIVSNRSTSDGWWMTLVPQ